jgi:hypothetical protein
MGVDQPSAAEAFVHEVEEPSVRDRIDRGVRAGDGWRVISSGARRLRPAERSLGEKLRR